MNHGDSSDYVVALNLDDNTGTKASAKVILRYKNKTIHNIETKQITYKNIAPPNAWFSFTPVPGCSISINTNNNPIKLKTCDKCTEIEIVSGSNALKQVSNTPTISIKSDNKNKVEVEFTYVPIKKNVQ